MDKRYTQLDTYLQTFPATWYVVTINVAQAHPNKIIAIKPTMLRLRDTNAWWACLVFS